MPPQRRSTPRAPHSRIYATEPPLRQSRMRQRMRMSSAPTPKQNTRIPVQASESQETLTQMPGFFVPSSMSNSGNDSDDEMSNNGNDENQAPSTAVDSEWQDDVPRKKRRVSKGKMKDNKRQSTLTQLQWPSTFGDSDNEENLAGISAVDIENNPLPPSLQDTFDPPPDTSMEDTWDRQVAAYASTVLFPAQHIANDEEQIIPDSDASDDEPSLPSPQRNPHSSPTHEHTPRKRSPLRYSTFLHNPNGEGPSRSPPVLHHPIPTATPLSFATPQRPTARREIPSSQSPAATPLGFATPASKPRTPLGELKPNILAQRDEDSSQKRNAASKGKKVCSPAEHAFGETDENISPADPESQEGDDFIKPYEKKVSQQQGTSFQQDTPSQRQIYGPERAGSPTPVRRRPLQQVTASQATTTDEENSPSRSPEVSMPPPPLHLDRPPLRRPPTLVWNDDDCDEEDLTGGGSSSSRAAGGVSLDSELGMAPSIYDSGDIISATQLCGFGSSSIYEDSQERL